MLFLANKDREHVGLNLGYESSAGPPQFRRVKPPLAQFVGDFELLLFRAGTTTPSKT